MEAGFSIQLPVPRMVKCGILCYAADNLEAHQLAGISACFSSKDICRHCHCQYNDLESHIHDFDGEPHKYWTEGEYNKIVRKLEKPTEEDVCIEDVTEPVDAEDLFTEADMYSLGQRDDSDDETTPRGKWGVKSECPFNVLASFHSVTNFPPDVLHDIFEGVVPEDLLSIIRILSSGGVFTIEKYNETLLSLGFSSYEAGDKPCPVPTSSKVKKLKGKAVSNWVHIRNFPLVIRKFPVPINNPVLDLALKLHEIVERVCAQQFFTHEVMLLDEKIVNYLNLRKEIRTDYPDLMSKPKPKHHFLREGLNKNKRSDPLPLFHRFERTVILVISNTVNF